MSTIIECPACNTRYKMNKPIPEGGRSVKCARCGHQWRLMPQEPPEELTDALEPEEGASAAGMAGHSETDSSAEPAPASHHAASYHQAHSPGPAPSWEARRGTFAAAIPPSRDAGMQEDDDRVGEGSGGYGETPRRWAGPPAYRGGYADTQDDAAAGAAESGSGEDDTDTGSGPWRSGGYTEEAGEHSDPENSVRQAIHAAMDDQDGSEESDYGAESGTSAVSRAFADASFEDTLSGVAAEAEAGGAHGHAGLGPDGRIRLARGMDGQDAAAESTVGEAVAQASTDAGTQDSQERFESDIAGIFSKKVKEKRVFSRAARKKEPSLADYDGAAESPSGEADDRYMADSPLDADAAALQAVLEGSLRDRHAEEGRGGGGLALAAAWAVFLSVLSGVTLAFVSFRDEIVAALPGTAALYRSAGFEVQDRQVDFGPISYRWTVTDGKPMIEVTGQIINLTDREIPVPRVLVQVHDKETTDTVKATATVRSEPLAARETADFTLEFLSPPKTISQIELAFAEAE